MPISDRTGVTSLYGVSFQRNYNWEVNFPSVIGTTHVDSTKINPLVRSVWFGDYSVDSPSTMRVGPFRSNFVSLLSVQTIKIELLKTTPDLVVPYFNNWKTLMVDASGLFQPKNSYQANIYIRLFNREGNITEHYKCIGCFPTTFPQYQLDYNKNDMTMLTVVFTVDKIEYVQDPSN
jgi:hypothetical protein